MSFERKLYVRRVERISVFYEVWESTAGKPQYIEQDGKVLYAIQDGETVVNSLVAFHEPSPEERILVNETIKLAHRLETGDR